MLFFTRHRTKYWWKDKWNKQPVFYIDDIQTRTLWYNILNNFIKKYSWKIIMKRFFGQANLLKNKIEILSPFNTIVLPDIIYTTRITKP